MSKRNDGKDLEALVSVVEKALLGENFTVEVNDKVYEDGVQIAELDVHITGKVGSSEFKWLIECRDRPSSGPAPVSWIEQLAGRRDRLKVNMVIAVSTTGFAKAAIKFANEKGIQLRQVTSLSPEAFSEWFQLDHLTGFEQQTSVDNVLFRLADDCPKETSEAFLNAVRKAGNSPVLRSTRTNELTTVGSAFLGALQLDDQLKQLTKPHQTVRLLARYVNEDDHFVVDTEFGPVRIFAIEFDGKVTTVESRVPVLRAQEYQHQGSSEVISQVVTFEPIGIGEDKVSVELHRTAQDGVTHVVFRKV